MTRRLGRTGAATDRPSIRLDDNVESYEVLRDGRSAEGRIRQVRLDRIEASPFQVRRVFRSGDRGTGREHPHQRADPRAQGPSSPDQTRVVELMPGEMRVRALKRLVETGEAKGVLTRDAHGEWLIRSRSKRSGTTVPRRSC